MIHMIAKDVEASVREMYRKNGYVCLSQLRNGTGYERAPRTADMLAVSTWPSRGLFCEGIEIKVSKGDLARELSTPEKAEAISQYCEWWWVAFPEGMVDAEYMSMIPATWGIICVNEALKARIVRRGEKLNPKPMDTLFVCAVLRNVCENYVPKSDLDMRVKVANDRYRKESEARRVLRSDELEAGYRKFKECCGIDLLSERGRPRYDIKDLGEAVRLVMELRGRPLQEMLEAKKALALGIEAIEAALGPLAQQVPKEAA